MYRVESSLNCEISSNFELFYLSKIDTCSLSRRWEIDLVLEYGMDTVATQMNLLNSLIFYQT